MKNLLKTVALRKLSMLFLLASIFLISSSMRSFGTVEIASRDGYAICSGYDRENMALVVVVSPPPIPVPPNVRLEYLWTANHANGNKTWQTTFPERLVPIPWAGPYEVNVRVMYFNRNKSRAFASFTSNTIEIVGLDCNRRRSSRLSFSKAN